MKLFRVNSVYLEDAVLTEDAFKQFLSLQTNDPYWSYETIEAPSEDEIADALYWDDDEQAFMPGAFA